MTIRTASLIEMYSAQRSCKMIAGIQIPPTSEETLPDHLVVHRLAGIQIVHVYDGLGASA